MALGYTARENEYRTLAFQCQIQVLAVRLAYNEKVRRPQFLSRHARHCICHHPPPLVVPSQFQHHTLWEALPQLLPASGSLPLCGPTLFMKTTTWYLSSSIYVCCPAPLGHKHLAEVRQETFIFESPAPSTEQARGRYMKSKSRVHTSL